MAAALVVLVALVAALVLGWAALAELVSVPALAEVVSVPALAEKTPWVASSRMASTH